MATTQVPLTGSTVITTNAAPTMGRFNRYNATAGGLSVILPALSGQNVGARTSVQKYMADVSANTITFTCSGADKFDDGATTVFTLTATGEQREVQVISVSGTKRWKFVGTLSVDTPVSGDGVFNVKDFGALGNGTADDTAAINAAIAALAPGNTLFFPQGRYMTNGGHVIDTPSVTIKGPTGRGAPFWGSTQLYLRNGANADMLTLAAPQITLRELSLYGNQPNQTGASRGIATSPTDGANYFLLDTVWVENFNGDGYTFEHPTSSIGGQLTNCECRENTGYGMSFYATDIIVTDCYVAYNTQSGLFCHTGSVSFNSCHIWGNGTALTGNCDGVTLYHTDQCQIMNCYIETNNDAGIELLYGSGSIIIGCDIWANRTRGIYSFGADHAVISNNLIHYNNSTGNTGSGGAEIAVDTGTAMMITGNQLFGGRASYGYYEIGASNTDIKFIGNMCRPADFVTGDTVFGVGTNTGKATRANPRVTSAASASSLTPDISAADMYAYTALAANLTINAPTGTPVDGNELNYRIKDNGTTRTLTWNAIFRAVGVTIPTATTANKTVYVHTKYNFADTKWDVVRVSQEV